MRGRKFKVVEENIIVERFDVNRNNLTFDSYEQVLYWKQIVKSYLTKKTKIAPCKNYITIGCDTIYT